MWYIDEQEFIELSKKHSERIFNLTKDEKRKLMSNDYFDEEDSDEDM